MRERRKSYRERYFENYQAVKVPSSNRRGYRVEYRYTGLFARWEGTESTIPRVKQRIGCLEAASVLVYVLSALPGAPLTKVRLFNGFGVLSLIPWLMEIYGVIRFVFAKEYVKEPDAEEIGNALRMGCVLRVLLVGLSVIAGEIQLLIQGGAAWADLPAALGILISGGISYLVKRSFDSLSLLKYHNTNGQPGSPA